MRTGLVCPSCHATETHGFYRVRGIPAHSALLLPTRAEALALPRGEIELRHCWRCNTVFNAAFDPLLAPTTGRCEERQAYSPHFRAWRRRLVEDLVARHDLRDRTILEIGCGGGDFLALLCEIGGNRGVGFDPVFRQENDLGAARDRVTVHRGLYSEREGDLRAEFVVCKLTLGQIPDTFAFLAMLRRALDDRRDTPVFFLEPDVGVALDEARFQDVCYDRCSSFDAGSLEALFRRAGFGDIEVGSGLDGRYLTLEARPNGPAVAADVAPPPLADDGDGQRLGNRVARQNYC